MTVVGFGAGKCFTDNIKRVRKYADIEIVADNSPLKIGTVVMGCKCVDMDYLLSLKCESFGLLVVVFVYSAAIFSDIKSQLETIGIKNVTGFSEYLEKKQTNNFKSYVPVYTSYNFNGVGILNGKTALITGGSGGIGFAIAKAFSVQGADVIMSGRNIAKLKGKADSINVKYAEMNLCDVSSIKKACDKTVQMSDNGSIDILVNAAGILNSNDFFNITEDEYDAIMDTNLKGTFFVSQTVSRYMMNNELVDGCRGHIIIISSASSVRPGWTPYQLSKWGVRGFTLGLADILLPHGIIVNAIAPGPVATGMLGKESTEELYCPKNPMKRYAHPDEIANTALFLASGLGNLIVGDTIFQTGGSGILSLHH